MSACRLAYRMIRHLGMLCVALNMIAANAASTLPTARDFVADARLSAMHHQPIVVLVNLSGCPHCELVRRSYLLPLLNEPAAAHTPIIRQVELNGERQLIDFNGKRITHGAFSRRLGITLAPVVLFFSPQGNQLAEPLIGSMIADFYGAYFDASLASARAALSRRQEKINP